MSADENEPPRRDLRSWGAWKRYAFALVPTLAFLELAAHVAQATRHVADADWILARDAVQAELQPDDLVTFAPGWVDPIGRSVFKDVATLEREARPDDTRFARAIEVSIRDAHLAELAAWKVTGRKRVGAITLTTYENPSFAKVLDDLVTHLAPGRAELTHVDARGETSCPFTRTRSQSGNIGYGPAIPGDRFLCPDGGFAGVSVVQALDYLPHRCIFAPPPGSGGALRLRFTEVAFGKTLHGHHAISWAQERYHDGAQVTLTFRSGEHLLGKLVHSDGDGWKSFELDTSELEGTRGDLIAEVSSPNPRDRLYCFEADTR